MGGKRRTAFVLSAVVCGMLGLAYASVPLYKLFCQVTGYGGTTQRAEQAPTAETASTRMIKVLFDANTAKDLPWDFKPEQRSVTVRVGEEALAFFSAHNTADSAVTGQATFNVTPAKAGLYFVKVACFCFDEQTLQIGPVVSGKVPLKIMDAKLAYEVGYLSGATKSSPDGTFKWLLELERHF